MLKKKDQRLPPPEEIPTNKNERWNRDLSPALGYDYIEILKQVKSMHEIGYDVHWDLLPCCNAICNGEVDFELCRWLQLNRLFDQFAPPHGCI